MKLGMVVVCILPGWDQNPRRFAFGMPVDDGGEGGKEKTGWLTERAVQRTAGQADAEGMTGSICITCNCFL